MKPLRSALCGVLLFAACPAWAAAPIGYTAPDGVNSVAVTAATPLPVTSGAGTAVIGKVGIDQTAPGTSNGVVINSAPTGTSAAQVQGAGVAGSATVGNPVRGGCTIASIYAAATAGNTSDLICGTDGGGLRVQATAWRDGTAGADNNAQIACMFTTDGACRPLFTTGGFRNAAGSLERAYDTGAAAANGTAATGIGSVEEAGRPFSNITTAATTTVKSGKGFLHSLTINTYVASATITVYDNTAGSGTKIATITLPSTITALAPLSLTYDAAYNTGLTIVTSGATDVTVTYR